MKHKEIEKLPPLPPEKERGCTTTVQTLGDILILNVYNGLKLRGRHAINTETGEYSQYTDGKWTRRKYGTLLGLDMMPYGYWSSDDAEKKAVFDSPEQKKAAMTALPRHGSIFDTIDELERRYGREKRWETEDRRRARVNAKMAMVPPLPKDISQWIWQQEGSLDYAFKDKAAGVWHCTACGSDSKDLISADGGKAKNNSRAVCPACGAAVTAKNRTDKVRALTSFTLIQRLNDEMSVVREVSARIDWREKRQVWMSEDIRVILYRQSSKPPEIFFNQCGREWDWEIVEEGQDYMNQNFDDRSNLYQRRTREGHLYPKGIKEALDGTQYQKWGRIFAQMGAAQKLNYTELLFKSHIANLEHAVEYLFKGRFPKLLKETINDFGIRYRNEYGGPLNLAGRTIEEVFGIPDRQMINRIRDMDGGERTVKWLRYGYKTGQKIPQETLTWMEETKTSPENTDFINSRMSPAQIANYVKRQQTESYPGMSAAGILGQWKDYLDTLKKLKRKADDPMIFRPRELKRRHDECVEDWTRQQDIIRLIADAPRREEEAQRMREKFPGAEEALREIKERYEYSNDQYRIIVPTQLLDIITEGATLHHCAGAVDRYFDRIMQQETYICFLRKVKRPERAFYTIEVEPGGTIRQHRGMYDEEPGIEQIRPFLKEWQQVLKRRLTKEDKERAKVSAVKRQQNIEELQAKNNLRVLRALEEDFMEVV